VLAGRRPSPYRFPERWSGVAGVALVFGALYVFSGDGGAGEGLLVRNLPGVCGLLVPATAVLWPQPLALRAAVALSAAALLAPDAEPTRLPLLLAVMAAAGAIVLVATNRLSTASAPALGGPAVPPRPRRVAGEAAVVAAVLAVAALLSTVVDPPQRQSPPQPGAEPARDGDVQPSPLTYDEVLDPAVGGPGDGNDILLRVDSPRADVWRALTYDQWDGRRWRRSRGLEQSRIFAERFVPVRGEPFRRGADELRSQRVRIEASYATVAVAAPQVQYFEMPGGAAVAGDGSVRLVPPLGRGATYRAHGMRVAATEAEMRTAGAAVPRRLPGGYLDAPTISPRARDLAVRVTAGAPSAYDQVRALERWIDANVKVDDDAPALADGADPVDAVLFGGRARSAQQLATALAVLTRSVGIPSRLATGFLPGDRPLFGGDFVVRSRHAHAWVEVPFTGLGWQRFDPTGRIARAEEQDSFLSRLRRFLARWWPVLVAAVVVALVLAVRVVVLRRRRLRARPWATRAFERLVRLGADRGRPRKPAETPAEYAAALAEGPVADERLHTVGRLLTTAAWSGREPAEADRRWVDHVLEEAAAAGGSRRRRAKERRSTVR
jgi:transglutaminase-like putative cysteine protease